MERHTQCLPLVINKIHQPSTRSGPLQQSQSPLFSLPQLSSAATKADRYASLTEFDRRGLQRPKAHVRNALKTTENLDKISKQLNERLQQCKGSGESKSKVSFDRLSACRDAFEKIIKTSGLFSGLLRDIKDMYNQHLVAAISHQHMGKQEDLTIEDPTNTESAAPNAKRTDSGDLLQLKKQLHHLEVESRVLIRENNRLREELVKEKEIYIKFKQQETADLKTVQPISPQTSSTSIQDYASRVENLQLQIAEERLAISKIISERKGRIPLSVCHNLEQCLREVEIETQKCQRHSQHLHEEIKKWKAKLWEQLKARGHSDHFRGIWDTIITAQ